MNFERAREVGEAGERGVSEELRRLSTQYDFEFLDDLYIQVAGHTTQLDHVLVDRFGFLVIETKVRNALIRGSQDAKKWTACYHSGAKKSFQNPLDQNRTHKSLLRSALAGVGFEVAPDFLKSAIVFVDANLIGLELDALKKAQVVTLDGLSELLKGRQEFAVNAGDWNPDNRAEAFAALRRADGSGDPEIVGKHAVYHGHSGSSANVGAKPQAALSGRGPTHEAPRPPEQVSSYDQYTPPYVPLPPHRPVFRIAPMTIVLLVLAVAALIFVAFAAYGMVNGTAPSWVWIVAFVVLAGLGGEARSGSRGRSSSRSSSRASAHRTVGDRIVGLFVALVMAAAVMGLWWWAFMGGGLLRLMDFGSTQERIAPAATAPTVEQAKQVLAAEMPDIYAKVAAPDSPAVSVTNGYHTFTWEYLEQTGDNAAAVRTVTLHLDDAGEVWGVEMR